MEMEWARALISHPAPSSPGASCYDGVALQSFGMHCGCENVKLALGFHLTQAVTLTVYRDILIFGQLRNLPGTKRVSSNQHTPVQQQVCR